MKAATVLFFLFLLISCQQQKKEGQNDIKKINVKIDKFNHLLEVSSFYDALFIPLEMTEKSKIGNIDKVIIYDDFIFVLDALIAKKLFVFNKSGFFIRTIGMIGKGDGEYIQLSDFDVKGDIIYISSQQDNRMLLFNLQDEHLKDVRFSGYIGYEFISLPEESFLMADVKPSNKSAIFYNKKGKKINTIINSRIDFLNNCNPLCFTSYKNIQYMYFGMNDTIYKIQDNQLIPRLMVDFGKKSIPYNKIKSNEEFLTFRERSEFLDLITFMEKSKYYFIEVGDRSYTYKAVVDKISEKLQYGNILTYKNFPISKPVGEIENGIILTYGPPIEPIYTSIFNIRYKGFMPSGFYNNDANTNPGIVILNEI